jgi:hypothetical protein
MATAMERLAYQEIQKMDHPLNVPNPDSIHPTRFPVRAPKHPYAVEPSPQLTPFDGFPVGTGVGGQERRAGMGSLVGFGEQIEVNEPAGAKHRITQFVDGDASQAVVPAQAPNWLGGHVMGPAVPRWEEQPEMALDKNSIAPRPDMTVSPAASSY